MTSESQQSSDDAAAVPHNSDLCERRRQQNREAQRRFRNKRTQQRLAEAQAALSLSHPPAVPAVSNNDRAGSSAHVIDASRPVSRSQSFSQPTQGGSILSASLPSHGAGSNYFEQQFSGIRISPPTYSQNTVPSSLYSTHRSSLPTTPFVILPAGADFSFNPELQSLSSQHLAANASRSAVYPVNDSSSAALFLDPLNQADFPDFLDMSLGVDPGLPDITSLHPATLGDPSDPDNGNTLLQNWLKTNVPYIPDPFSTAITGSDSFDDTFTTPSEDHGRSEKSLDSASDPIQAAPEAALRKDKSSQPLLHLSIESGHESIVKVLLDSGVDIDERDEHGSSGVHIAVKTRQDGILRLLLERGANANVVDSEDRTPTQLAIMTGFETGLRLLLKHNAPSKKAASHETTRSKRSSTLS